MTTRLVPFPDHLALVPVSRWPTTLPADAVRIVLGTPPSKRIRRIRRRPAKPVVSFVVVTCDGLFFSRLCLESLLAARTAIPYEVIVVDNASADGTAEYLADVSSLDARVRVERSRRNTGFAAATNAGVAVASGDVIVLLNNDTIVPAGFLEHIVDRLQATEIGLLGAVTNRAGNEAQIETAYGTYGEFRTFARRYTQAHAREMFDIRTATMFCTAMRRDVWDDIGPLDEQFELGLFEDDDYAMRARQRGYRVVCAEDLFVHHFGQATIGHLGPTGRYGRLFHANRSRWEAKWGTAWHPYERREKAGYRELVARVRTLVSDRVPTRATVAVISKGDGELLRLDDRLAWHFPQAQDGGYAGHHPADSEACIEELERMRACGAGFLVVPATARWWLQHYDRFGAYLRTRYETIADDRSAAIFSLRPRPAHA
jgi:GT2 family glycosyltransferase